MLLLFARLRFVFLCDFRTGPSRDTPAAPLDAVDVADVGDKDRPSAAAVRAAVAGRAMVLLLPLGSGMDVVGS